MRASTRQDESSSRRAGPTREALILGDSENPVEYQNGSQERELRNIFTMFDRMNWRYSDESVTFIDSIYPIPLPETSDDFPIDAIHHVASVIASERTFFQHRLVIYGIRIDAKVRRKTTPLRELLCKQLEVMRQLQHYLPEDVIAGSIRWVIDDKVVDSQVHSLLELEGRITAFDPLGHLEKDAPSPEYRLPRL